MAVISCVLFWLEVLFLAWTKARSVVPGVLATLIFFNFCLSPFVIIVFDVFDCVILYLNCVVIICIYCDLSWFVLNKNKTPQKMFVSCRTYDFVLGCYVRWWEPGSASCFGEGEGSVPYNPSTGPRYATDYVHGCEITPSCFNFFIYII